MINLDYKYYALHYLQYDQTLFNLDPHCFKAIIKLIAWGVKRAIMTPFTAQHCGRRWREGEGCFLCSLEDFFIINMNFTHIIMENSLKMPFLWETPETKKFARYFARHVDIQELFLLYSIKKGFFHP
jgi:hypothetical protein